MSDSREAGQWCRAQAADEMNKLPQRDRIGHHIRELPRQSKQWQ